MSEHVPGNDFPVGVYFYPQTNTCPVRRERMADFGHTAIDETLLVQQAAPLFDGHRQPRTYCLGELAVTRWDDADEKAIGLQAELMRDAQLDFVVFNSFGGSRQGATPVREIDRPHDAFLALGDTRKNIQFGTMWCDAGPRANLPTPLKKGLGEPGRWYDLSVQTAQFIIDQCVDRYWEDPGHLYIKDRPYLSFNSTAYSSSDPKVQTNLEGFINTLKEYAQQAYKTDPYVVAVAMPSTDTPKIKDVGFDAVSSYAYLPDFTKGYSALQSYAQRVDATVAEWGTVPYTFVPSAVVDWDASPRGENGPCLEEVLDTYPYTPVMLDGGPDAFSDMLQRSLRWTQEHVPKREQYGIVCSWNEIGEGCALLPEIREGEVDFSYIEAVSRVIAWMRSNPQ